jgi:hypothetical protein
VANGRVTKVEFGWSLGKVYAAKLDKATINPMHCQRDTVTEQRRQDFILVAIGLAGVALGVSVTTLAMLSLHAFLR